MKAVFKTKEEFLAEGFKESYNTIYIGDKKHPDACLRLHVLGQLGGKQVEVVEVYDAQAGMVTVLYGRHTYNVHTWALREHVDFGMIAKPATLMIRGKAAKFYGISFKFSCDHDELTTKEAVKLAKWVLQKAGDK